MIPVIEDRYFKNKYGKLKISDINLSDLATDIREMQAYDVDVSLAHKLWDMIKDNKTTAVVEVTGAASDADIFVQVPSGEEWEIINMQLGHDDSASRNGTIEIQDSSQDTEILLANSEAIGAGSSFLLTELLPSVLPITVSPLGYIAFKIASLGAGKKITYKIGYNIKYVI